MFRAFEKIIVRSVQTKAIFEIEAAKHDKQRTSTLFVNRAAIQAF
jgi:hypothetical protein